MAPSRRKGAGKASSAAAAARQQWKVGDLVLAKMKGFPAWPATVSEPEKWGFSTNWKKVLVYFFGTKQIFFQVEDEQRWLEQHGDEIQARIDINLPDVEPIKLDPNLTSSSHTTSSGHHFYLTAMHQIAFCNPADVEAFTEEKKKSLLFKLQGKGADFVRAVEEIIDSYEKTKKQDQVVEFNSGDEGTVSITGNSEGSLGKSWMKGQTQSPVAMPNSCLETLFTSTNRNDSSNSIDVPVAAMEMTELHDMETISGECNGNSSFLNYLRETPSEISNFSGKRLRETPIQGCFIQRRAPSVRRSRSSSRVDPCKFQSLIIPLNGCSKATEDVARNAMWDESGRNKLIKKSPDSSVGRGLDSPVHSAAFVSNGSSEDIGSEIVATNSDTISFNEVSTVESSSKVEHPEIVYLGRHVDLCERLDLQSKAVFLKKKRKPNRKRVTQDAAECPARLDKEGDLGAGVSKTVPKSPHGCEKLNEWSCKEDGDEHLPLVKRARVRMGKPSREEKELDNFINTEEKPSEEVFVNHTEPVSTSVHCNDTSSADRPSMEVKGAVSGSSPLKNCTHFAKNGTVFWKDKISQWRGGSLDGEAALPPSKRLHRALEAMSANAAEDDQACSEAPWITKTLSNRCSASSDLSSCHTITDNEVGNALEVRNVNSSVDNTSLDVTSGFATSLTPQTLEQLANTSSDVRACTQLVRSSISPRLEDSKELFREEDMIVLDAKDHDASSIDTCTAKTEIDVDVKNSQPCPSNFGEERDNLISGQDLVRQPSPPLKDCKNDIIDTCNTHSDYIVKGEGCSHVDKDKEHGSIVQRPNSVSEAKEVNSFSSLDRVSGLLSVTDWDSCENSKPLKSLPHENSEFKGMCEVMKDFKHKQTQEDMDPTSMKVLIAAAHAKRHLSRSTSDNPLDDKVISDAVSSSPSTDRVGSAEQVSLPNSSSFLHALDNRNDLLHNVSGISDSISHHKKGVHLLEVDGEGKPESTMPHRQKSFGKWSVLAEANAARKSFEAMLETLTRTKESIGRATRLAMDCAKYGIASEVMEILVRNLESELSLHRRVDLFFLVDSITQCSRGQKGVGDIFPSAVQAVLPRLLSAAAPPGNAASENRRQCLKVLRLWLERKTLPESIIRHHMRELDSITDASSFSRRPSRTERAFNDPLREMEGMLVDEYGSNTSFQLPGFHMPRMLQNEDEGSDSDEKSFEAVTPEHEPEVPVEQETTFTSATEKHRHILEDVDGELEMEDVAPTCEVEMNSFNKVTGSDTVHTSHGQFDRCLPLPLAPPLPEDGPPCPPPLPTSPPPVAPPPPPLPPPPSVMPLPVTDGADSKLYTGTHEQSVQNHLQHSVAQQQGRPNGNSVTLDTIPYYAPGYRDPSMPMQRPSSSHSFGSCGSLRGSIPSAVHSGNNVQQTDGAPMDNKAYHLQPPPPMLSNQFSYVQPDQKMQSWRETSSSSFTKKFEFVHDMNGGNFYDGRDRMKLAPREIGDGGRHSAPLHSGSAHFDKADRCFGPLSYYGQPGEPARAPNHGWAFPPRGSNFSHSTPLRPPSEAPNFWRPR